MNFWRFFIFLTFGSDEFSDFSGKSGNLLEKYSILMYFYLKIKIQGHTFLIFNKNTASKKAVQGGFFCQNKLGSIYFHLIL